MVKGFEIFQKVALNRLNILNHMTLNSEQISSWLGMINTQLNQLTAAHKVGDVSGGNYTEIATDGSERFRGNATMWTDMVGDLFGKRLASTSGKVDYDFDENAINFQSGGVITTANDRVGANLEINHDRKVGSSITFRPHIHWFQAVSSGAVTAFVLTMRYRLQRNNYEKTASWTTVTLTAGTDDVFDFTGESDGTYNQLSRFPDITIDCGISDTLQFQMTRTDSESGDMLVYFMDVHGQVDGAGSEDEIVKRD